MPKSSDALIVSTPIAVRLELASGATSQYQRPVVMPTVARTATSELLPVATRSLPESVTFASLSVALQVLVLPITGATADYGRRKKECLAGTAYVGAAATIAMFFLKGGDYMLGGALFLIANIAFGASIVVYNSFLPEIAPPEQRVCVPDARRTGLASARRPTSLRWGRCSPSGPRGRVEGPERGLRGAVVYRLFARPGGTRQQGREPVEGQSE